MLRVGRRCHGYGGEQGKEIFDGFRRHRVGYEVDHAC